MSFEEKAENAKPPDLPTEFKFDESLVRAIVKEGEPWFVAKDVCDILDIGDPSKTVDRLDEDEIGTTSIRTTSGPREMLTVNESGVYSLVFTSRKPEAKRFRKWVTRTVLPEIRKTGATRDPVATSASRTMRSITSVGSSSARCSTLRSSPSKCSVSASISSSR